MSMALPRVTVKREVTKSITDIQKAIAEASKYKSKKKQQLTDPAHIQERMAELEQLMQEAADNLDFEKAIALRDEWHQLQKALIKQ